MQFTADRGKVGALIGNALKKLRQQFIALSY